MSPVPPMSAMSELEWSTAWRGEQERVDQLHAQRGSWLPNVVEVRDWGAIRWTSGRPRHAADTGQAAAESFVVVSPEHKDLRDAAAAALRDPAPIAGFAGFTVRRETLAGAVIGALLGVVLGVLVMVLASLPVALGVFILVVLTALGAVGGALAGRQANRQRRTKVVADSTKVRNITGRYAPEAWSRLVIAATQLEAPTSSSTGAGLARVLDPQATEAVHQALWEASGLLLGSSNHTGVEVLADGVERLADAHRI